jgi:CHASE2 domain-containing sensor protein
LLFSQASDALSNLPPSEPGQKETVDIQRTIRYALSLSLVLVFLLHVGGTLSLPLLDTLENHAYDARVRLITPPSAGEQVVIVDINEKSLQAIGH